MIVSTPRCVYLLEPETERLVPLHDSRPEYYGVSWGGDRLVLSHSLDENVHPWQPEDSRSDRRFGVISAYGANGVREDSPKQVLHGHQLEVVGADVVVSNTGRNAISVWRRIVAQGWLSARLASRSLEHRYLVTSRWDGLEPGTVSLHLNSVHVQGDSLYAVAHNGSNLSAIWQFTWPALELAAVFGTAARWAHNAWHSGTFAGLLTCNSRRGTIYSVDHDEDIWSCGDDEKLTRGLAASPDTIVVGLSEYTPRSERATSDGGVAIVDRTTLRTRDALWFGGIGNVHEVRLLDVRDECHAAAAPGAAVLDTIAGWAEEGRSRAISPKSRGLTFVAGWAPSDRIEPRVLEYGDGAGMAVEIVGNGNARVSTQRIGDSNLLLSRGDVEPERETLLIAKAWCIAQNGARDAYARLRVCFRDAQGQYLTEHEARSEPAGLGEAERHWLDVAVPVPRDARVRSVELMWLQSGRCDVQLRACAFSRLSLPGSMHAAEALPTSF